MNKTNKLINLLALGIVSTLSLFSTANAEDFNYYKFKVINNTAFDVQVQELEGVQAGSNWNDINNYIKRTIELKEVISSGNTSSEIMTKDEPYFAPGIDKIPYRKSGTTEWKDSETSYGQTNAKLLFTKHRIPVAEESIKISPEHSGVQPLTFQYKGKEVKIDVTVTSAEHIWYAFISNYGRDEKYYDYTITIKQQEHHHSKNSKTSE